MEVDYEIEGPMQGFKSFESEQKHFILKNTSENLFNT